MDAWNLPTIKITTAAITMYKVFRFSDLDKDTEIWAREREISRSKGFGWSFESDDGISSTRYSDSTPIEVGAFAGERTMVDDSQLVDNWCGWKPIWLWNLMRLSSLRWVDIVYILCPSYVQCLCFSLCVWKKVTPLKSISHFGTTYGWDSLPTF